jgi:putative flippase GtrA
MIRRLLLENQVLIKQMFMYGVIGGISALTDSIVFYFLHFDFGVYVSNFISINVGITLSFLMNTYLNFKTTDSLLKRAISFFSVGYTGLLLSMLILFIGVEILTISGMAVKLFSIIIVAALQFLLNKSITFKGSAYVG